MKLTARQVAEKIGATLEGEGAFELAGVAAPERAGKKDLIYVETAKHLERATASYVAELMIERRGRIATNVTLRDTILDVVEDVTAGNSDAGIIPTSLLTEQLDRLQPIVTFGAARNARLMPYKTYAAKGVIWAGGSDYYVTPFTARYGIWSTVARKTLNATYGAQPFGTAEAVDVHAALRSYTIWAAHQLFLEDRIGSLEVGKEADIAIWDRDLYTIPPDELKNLKCEWTLLNGKTVYRDPASPIT